MYQFNATNTPYESSYDLLYNSLFEIHIKFLVLRRHVIAKRRTIVLSAVRPSLQQIVELSKKFQVFYTFNGIIGPDVVRKTL